MARQFQFFVHPPSIGKVDDDPTLAHFAREVASDDLYLPATIIEESWRRGLVKEEATVTDPNGFRYVSAAFLLNNIIPQMAKAKAKADEVCKIINVALEEYRFWLPILLNAKQFVTETFEDSHEV